MKPIEVNDRNEQRLLDTVYNYKIEHVSHTSFNPYHSQRRKQIRRTAVFKVGDVVRLSKYRTLFYKGYTPNWTTELFRIRKVQYNTNPITYLIVSQDENERIDGSFYAEELQSVKYPDVYLIEKIIRKGVGTRKGQVYVKWFGMGSKHNSWISEKAIL